MPVPLMMQWLIGTWFIISSDAPIWLKGDKTAPSLNYTLAAHKETYKLLDETKYTKGGGHKTIAGYDHSAANSDAAFVWRGKGMLFFVTSKWKVALRDPAGQWAVIAYSKTLFTPEGVDIMSRSPTLPETTLTSIRNMMMQDSMLAKHANRLKPIAQHREGTLHN